MTQARRLIMQEDAKSPIAEAFRSLRTNLQFSKVGCELKKILFTSAGPGEGKSSTAANLAIALAQNDKKVLLVDLDLRKPVQHQIFGLAKQGLTNILIDRKPWEEVVQATTIPNLSVITSGPIPPNPAELLDSQPMQQLLEEFSKNVDFLILDAPPIIPVTDAAILAAKVDGVILVLNARSTRPEMAQQAKEQLLKAQGKILGVILNQIEVDLKNSAYYYYHEENESKQVAR